jgi:uncharacterized protein (DUF2141 family)
MFKKLIPAALAIAMIAVTSGPVAAQSVEILDAPPEGAEKGSPMGRIVRGGSEHHLVVNVVNAEPATGTIEITLFRNDEFFMKDAYLQNSGPVREDGTFYALFNKLAEGEYAVVVVHDANDNQKLDSGFLGFGGERYAYSNNVRPWFGRPDFEDIAVQVSGSTQIEIRLD